MEPLPPEHAPNSATWRNALAVCAVMKDEAVDDVIEWLAYYRWLGAEHVFLTDNGSADFDALEIALAGHFPPSFLTLRQEATPRAQLKVYAWCAETQRARFNWLAFFDLDEFLAFPGSADPAAPPKVSSFLDDYKEDAALSVNWMIVGPSGHEARPEEGGVLRWYDQCITEVDWRVKTIANTWFLSGVTEHSHNFVFRDRRHSVGEHHDPLDSLSWRRSLSASCADAERFPTNDACTAAAQLPAAGRGAAFETCCVAMVPASRAPGSVERVALFHYATKSRADFEAKQRRGSGMSRSSKSDSYFSNIERAQERAPLCAVPAAAWPACCSPEALQKLAAETAARSAPRAA